jgi:hypothetical protein
MGRQNSNLRKIGSRPGPLADWNVGASVGTQRVAHALFSQLRVNVNPKEDFKLENLV